jgi:hypothetical protein
MAGVRALDRRRLAPVALALPRVRRQRDPFVTRAVPANVQALMKTPAYQQRMRSDPQFKNYPRYLKTAEQNLKRMADAGVSTPFGSTPGHRCASTGSASIGSWR